MDKQTLQLISALTRSHLRLLQYTSEVSKLAARGVPAEEAGAMLAAGDAALKSLDDTIEMLTKIVDQKKAEQ
ncbi:hypothetical protein [Burkholderia glumae]|uniref:hypothetical protein n=1 Tax=Burkholderia glumae TaxID=337 RepID=UPI000F5E927C|nr:hypothetical protein [Burkholderia glumae]